MVTFIYRKEPSQLARHHSTLYQQLCSMVGAARECGDTPNDVRAVVNILVEEALERETTREVCTDCQQEVKHVHIDDPSHR